MAEYRDIGYRKGDWYNEANTSLVDLTKYGQVYQATHLGSDRLPYMRRSFISFSYGERDGKRVQIEDFDLIAYTNGNRLSRNGYASFEDQTTSYDNLDGLYYWGTHYKTNSLTINLTTDGIDLKKLDDFLYWFLPGEAKELVLAEHPNRAIMARVSQIPLLNLLPFETKTMVYFNEFGYETSTTLYKGEIVLQFIMDEPFWYSIENILGIKDGNRYLNEWIDANGNLVSIFASEDALKILYEDGIPLASMINTDMILGNDTYATTGNKLISSIWSVYEANITWSGTPWAAGSTPSGSGAKIDPGTGVLGVIAGALIDASGNGISSLSANLPVYFFYAGTAPAPTIIQFTTLLAFDNLYISSPANSYCLSQDGNEYNIFTIESSSGPQHLYFTTPNLLTSYNKVLDIFENKIEIGMEWEKAFEYIRNDVRHPAVRNWARQVLTYFKNQNETSNINNSSYVIGTVSYFSVSLAKAFMSYMFKDKTSELNALTMSFTFNSKTGEAIGEFKYRQPTSTLPTSAEEWKNFGTDPTTIMKENVGDMLRSNYLYIKDKNYPTEKGVVTSWLDDLYGGKTRSHYFIHDVKLPLTNLKILYKNLYL